MALGEMTHDEVLHSNANLRRRVALMSTAPKSDGVNTAEPNSTPNGTATADSDRPPWTNELKEGEKDRHGQIIARIHHINKLSDYAIYENADRKVVIDGEGEKRVVENAGASLWNGQFGDSTHS